MAARGAESSRKSPPSTAPLAASSTPIRATTATTRETSIRKAPTATKTARSADQWVIRGNHYDAWVNGAADPISGQVAMLEEAKAIGELAKSGWRPKRTIIYAAWDGEEQGLLGSTEWAEEHGDELRQHGVVYINSDSNGRGFLGVGGSHTLERLVTQVARDVHDPERNVSVLERRRDREQTLATSEEARKEARERQLIRLDALGSG